MCMFINNVYCILLICFNKVLVYISISPVCIYSTSVHISVHIHIVLEYTYIYVHIHKGAVFQFLSQQLTFK